ncbi:hypothetical protein DdX_16526 [Ditylenchus destructor]|uniref:Uncharacterized protein n=1 Tax=Ditylenchus destructor TaxID=166010 RepID=A0AAD4QZU9_9BILA|nr:hypothetical protein DdX_16526 [Ditylenchus destructor]
MPVSCAIVCFIDWQVERHFVFICISRYFGMPQEVAENITFCIFMVSMASLVIELSDFNNRLDEDFTASQRLKPGESKGIREIQVIAYFKSYTKLTEKDHPAATPHGGAHRHPGFSGFPEAINPGIRKCCRRDRYQSSCLAERRRLTYHTPRTELRSES